MQLHERIQIALTHAGKSQATVAREMGITPSAITQWLSGRTKTLKAETALALERVTGVKAAWIATGTGQKFVDVTSAQDLFPSSVQLVSWQTAASWTSNEDEQEVPAVWIPSPIAHSDNAYALRVRGASMLNPAGPISFSEGDLIYIEPSQEPKSGSIVIARIGHHPEAILRQLLIEGDCRYLQALNPAWPDRIHQINSESVTLGGVVIARTTIFEK